MYRESPSVECGKVYGGLPEIWMVLKVKPLASFGSHEHLYGEQSEQMLGPVWQKARNDTWRPLLGHRAPRNHGALKGTAYGWTSLDARYGVKSLHAGMPLPLAWEEFCMIACTPAGLSF
jgi:hypothetical protein